MPVLPVRHFEWQVLRTVKRSNSPPTGRSLRLIPSRRTKDGSFLTDMVEVGLLSRVSGTAASPFEATYALTERGEHAAEHGECDFPMRSKLPAPPPPKQTQRARKGKALARAGR